MIPYHLFVLYCATIGNLASERELSAANAGAFAQALAFGAKDPGVKRYTRQLRRMAFPLDS